MTKEDELLQASLASALCNFNLSGDGRGRGSKKHYGMRSTMTAITYPQKVSKHGAAQHIVVVGAVLALFGDRGVP